MKLLQFDQAPWPEQAGQCVSWGGLVGAAESLAASQAAQRWEGCSLLLVADTQTLTQIEAECTFFNGGHPPLCLPWRETLAYEALPVAESLRSQRMDVLCRLPQLRGGMIIATVAEAMHRLPPRAWIQAQSLELDVGAEYSFEQAIRTLSAGGYRRVDTVCEIGEFAVRGALLDLYPAGSAHPLRVERCDDQIESLRYFDPDSQRTVARAERVRLAPVREYCLDEAGVERFLDGWHRHFSVAPQSSPLCRDLAAARDTLGAEYYLPLFFEHTDSLFDYLPANSLLIYCGDVKAAAAAFERLVQERCQSRADDLARPPLAPPLLFLDSDELEQRSSALPRLCLQSSALDANCALETQLLSVSPDVVDFDYLNRQLATSSKHRVLLMATSEGHAEVLRDELHDAGVKVSAAEDWADFVDGDAPCQLATAPLERGFALAVPPITLLPAAHLLTTQDYSSRPQARRPSGALGTTGHDLAVLTVGDLIVHEEHGLGRYQGLSTLSVDAHESDFLMLEYAAGARLYVPVRDLSLVRSYCAGDSAEPELHALGGRRWQRAVRRAARRASDTAAELLELQARRQQCCSEPLSPPEEDYRRFVASFPFVPTADQASAIEAVLQDMALPRPMDRLICGDVGLGKTEVALRATFAAVHSGKQVAILTPTTVLAEQHAATFRRRFSDWAVRIESLSRLVSAGKVHRLLDELRTGQLDIVIGTHRLLQQDVQFRQLGLVIIDEEHRFGLRHKERFKELRTAVDVLSLTATPIPRTLHVALSGLRDLSVIATAPEGRLPIRTVVMPWDQGTVRDALQRELQRGGQVYYVHNTISRLARTARELTELLPEVRVGIAHGGMSGTELRAVMVDFAQRRCNVLVCTTIIESGLDIANANTIVIERADQFGLAQLHQLRGRVGRAKRQAHAYLLTPADSELMNPSAVQRMAAVRDTRDFGAGFILARRDLELRGGGELLGLRQSGEDTVLSPGLYSELLERAVKTLRGEPPPPSPVQLELGVSAFLAADYVPDINQRLVLYRRIEAAADVPALRELEAELVDRFGSLPDPARYLLRGARLAQRVRRLGLCRIEAHRGGAVLHGCAGHSLDSTLLPQLPQAEAWRLEGATLHYVGVLEPAERHAFLERVSSALESQINS